MPSIEKLDPSAFSSEAYPEPLVWAYRLEFKRPGFLRSLTTTLIVLITAASFAILFVNDTKEGLVGITGLVFSIWSVRGVIVKGNLPSVTLVDILLGLVMTIVITICFIRVGIHFWRAAKSGDRVFGDR